MKGALPQLNTDIDHMKKIEDIIAKLLKGETLTDEEKTFAEGFSLEKVQNDKAAAARKDAEAKLKKAEDENTALQARLKEAEDSAKSGKESGDATVKAMQKQLADLTKAHKDAEAKVAKQERDATIREAAKAKGITCPDGMKEALFNALLDNIVGNVDVANADALNAVLDSFKADNPHMIVSNAKGGSGMTGDNPNPGSHTGPNPFSKKSFNLDRQIEIDTANPELSKKLQAEAEAEA